MNGNYFAYGQLQGAGVYGCDAYLAEIDGSNGNMLWGKNFELGSCETFLKGKIKDNAIYLVGRFNNAGGGQSQFRMSMTKVDFNGNHLWSRLYVRPTNVAARMYAQDLNIEQNSVLVSGFGDTRGISTSDVFMTLFRTDLDGVIQWCNTYDIAASSDERMFKIIEVVNGYMLCGNYTSRTGDKMIFLMNVDYQGNIISQKGLGRVGFNTSAYTVEFFDGKIHILGTTNSFGHGQDDILILKLNAKGEIIDDSCDFEVDIDVAMENVCRSF